MKLELRSMAEACSLFWSAERKAAVAVVPFDPFGVTARSGVLVSFGGPKRYRVKDVLLEYDPPADKTQPLESTLRLIKVSVKDAKEPKSI
jgi:hypothetical protein